MGRYLNGASPSAIEIVVRIPFERCFCPQCLSFDLCYPDEGYQLGFWRYQPVRRPKGRTA